MMNEAKLREALAGSGDDTPEDEDPVTIAGRELSDKMDLDGDKLDALVTFIGAVVKAG
jgi:hypothetical protein